MTVLKPILSQKTYPGVGDIDDCWAVATIYAYSCIYPGASLPHMDTFREAAGDPDDGVRDGGNLDEIVRAVDTLWPHAPYVRFQSNDWNQLMEYLKGGAAISIAVASSMLPSTLRYGFMGAHQVALIWDNAIRIMNPLGPNGGIPPFIAESSIKAAAFGLFGGKEVHALIFLEADVNPMTHRPVAVCDVDAGATVYGSDRRSPVLFTTERNLTNVGLYAVPEKPWENVGNKTRATLAALLFDLKSGPEQDLRIGWVGVDKVRNIRMPNTPSADCGPAIEQAVNEATSALRGQLSVVQDRLDRANETIEQMIETGGGTPGPRI